MLKTQLLILIPVLCSFQVTFGQYVDMRSVAEGNCPYQGFPVANNVNRTWFQTAPFRSIIAGSKYHLYRIATDASRSSGSYFVTLREHEFPQTACLESALDVRNGRGAVYSQGRLINNYVIRPHNPADFRVIDFTPVPQPPDRPLDISKHYITLTDNHSFVLFANCWTRSYQKSWDVLSTVPYLSRRAMDMIEYHIQNLGFDRRLSVFLRYDRCPR